MLQQDLYIRLLVSALFGALIGLEREVNHRPAGLRTHILVSVGSTLIMLISLVGFDDGDPARLAAQVVSGIGFLGAGTILRQGNEVRGLTTAASLWVSAAIGLAVGVGQFGLATVTLVIVLFSLVSLRYFQQRATVKQYENVKILCEERSGLLSDIGQIMAKNDTIIKSVHTERFDPDDETHKVYLELSFVPPSEIELDAILYEIRRTKSVLSVEVNLSKKYRK